MKKFIFLVQLLAVFLSLKVLGQENKQLVVSRPDAIADLKTREGADWVHAKWFVQNAHLVTESFNAPGPSPTDSLKIYPTGSSNKTNRLSPQIGTPEFENGFKSIHPNSLEDRQGTGLFSLVWYKLMITLPEKIGNVDVKGTQVVFEITMDDYSEIWVNGKQMAGYGQVGRGVISGYNAPNRVILTQNAEPGQTYTLAILGVNGVLGNEPSNYIWVRNANLDFYSEKSRLINSNIGQIYTLDNRLNQIIAPNTPIQKIADGFGFTEGPVWHPDGYLLFSDPNLNAIYRYNPQTNDVNIYMSHSGYSGVDIKEFGQPGSNGLTIDAQGRLIIDQMGNRRVIRIEKKGHTTVLADNFEGKKLNSPNDIVLRSDGTVYFTDPPYGLGEFYKDKKKELDFQGVFMIKDGKVKLVAKDCGGPNGIAFSPDEKYLYVTNWDIRDIHHTKTIWRYEVKKDGSLENGKIFFDCNQTENEEGLDGMKVDRAGNLFVSAPGGVWILSDKGETLGKIITPERPANMAWGDDDGKTLYFTAHAYLYKIRLLTGGKFAWQ